MVFFSNNIFGYYFQIIFLVTMYQRCTSTMYNCHNPITIATIVLFEQTLQKKSNVWKLWFGFAAAVAKSRENLLIPASMVKIRPMQRLFFREFFSDTQTLKNRQDSIIWLRHFSHNEWNLTMSAIEPYIIKFYFHTTL